MRARFSEEGQVTVMVLGMLLVVLAVSGLAVDGTRAFLERRALQNLADAAALAAADAIDVSSFYEGGGQSLSLDAASSRAAALEMIAASGRRASGAVIVVDDAVEVSLRGSVRTQFLRLVGIESLPVAATTRAQPEIGAIPAPGAR